MLLVVDIGNTNIVLGIFDKSMLRASWRLATDSTRTIDESWVMLSSLLSTMRMDPRIITQVAISSVVPDLTYLWSKLSENYLDVKPLQVRHDTPGLPSIRYVDPRQIGADRLCTTMAAWHYLRGPAIVIDFGTATTFDAVDHNGAFIGGLILPGLQTAMRILHSKAARLPKIEFAFPSKVIATSTEEAMQSGLLYGTVAQVEGLVQRMRGEMAAHGVPGEIPVLTTGGLGRMISRHCDVIHRHLPYLVLFGLALIHARCTGCETELNDRELRNQLEELGQS